LKLYIIYIYTFLGTGYLYQLYAQDEQLHKQIINMQKDTLVFEAIYSQKKKSSNFIQTPAYQKKIGDTLYLYILNRKYKLTKTELNKWLQNYNDSLIDEGYLYNKVYPKKIEIVNGKTKIYYQVIKNKQILLDSLIITGQSFPKNYLNNFMTRNKHKVLTKRLIEKTIKFITKNKHFIVTEQPAVLIDNNRHYLRINIKRNIDNTLSGLASMSYDADKKKAVLQGEIKIRLFDALKLGEYIGFRWQKNQVKQSLYFGIKLPYLWSSNLGLENIFNSTGQDSTSATIGNKTFLTWKYHKQQISFFYNTERIEEKNIIKNKFIGLNYRYGPKNVNDFYSKKLTLELNIKDIKSKKGIAWTSFAYYIKIKKWYFKQNWSYLINNTENLFNMRQLDTDFYRKKDIYNNEIKNIASLKNEIVYDYFKYKFYVIVDFIAQENLEEQRTKYVNTGIGIRIYGKNQNLTLEFIKPVALSYHSDYQVFYLNISQNIRF